MAIDFNSGTDKLLYGSNIDLSASELTLSLFINSDSFSISTHLPFSIMQSGDAAFSVSIFWISTGVFVIRRTGSTNKERRTAATPSLSTWHHICVADGSTFTDATQIQIFYDAAEQTYSLTQNGVTPAAGGGSWSIGQSGSGTNPYDGRIAELGVWNAKLIQSEIDILSKGYSPLFVRPQSLIFYTPLVRDPNDRKGKTATVTDTAVANHPRIIYPSRQSYNIIQREVNSLIGYPLNYHR